VEDSRPGGLIGIGDLARASGLPVSALRFYDGAGVLRPLVVDPRTGYRRYGVAQVRDARLLARLRRVGMPLSDVRALLAGAPDAEGLIDAQLARLEDGLAAARRELSAVRALLDRSEPAMNLTVPAAGLASALGAVRYAVGTDPAHPALHGVLLDRDGGTLHVVATDRYRLAVATVPVPSAGPAARVFLPAGVLDELLAVLADVGGEAVVTVSEAAVSAGGEAVVTVSEAAVSAGGRSVRTTGEADGYPDWRRLEPKPAPHRVPLSGPAFRQALAAGPAIRKVRDGVEYDTVVLTLAANGALSVGGDGDLLRVGVNRDFLLDALTGHDQLVLELDGPITPLAVRVPGGDWSLLMPVNLADPVPA
jgi:DNA polymerase-3 subunit beta